MSHTDTTSENSAPRPSDSHSSDHTPENRAEHSHGPPGDPASASDAGHADDHVHEQSHDNADDHAHDHDHDDADDHGHGHDHDNDHDDDVRQEEEGEDRPREKRKKGPSDNPENLSEQLVAGTLRGRRSKCSHGCGSDGSCSTGGCGVSSLVEMIANKFNYTDARQIVEVTFPGYRRGFAAVDEDTALRVRDIVVVRSPNGTDWGTVSMTGSLVHAKRKAKRLSDEELPKVVRKADENDLKRIEQCRVSERHAYSVCRTRIEAFSLPMILVGSEWQFDHKKLTFYFTADGRVDFRDLVRDLAAIFNTRIELRQIPVRDAAKRLGGMGVCGLELCCTTHLGRYEHVTLDHAKIQQIPANPSKLSGQCGRLKCCLLYEVDTYVEGLKRFPPLESTIETETGVGVIQKIDLFRDLIHLYHAPSSAWETLTLEDYRDIVAGRRKKKAPEPEPVKAPEAAREMKSEKHPENKAERKPEKRGEGNERKDAGRKEGQNRADKPRQKERTGEGQNDRPHERQKERRTPGTAEKKQQQSGEQKREEKPRTREEAPAGRSVPEAHASQAGGPAAEAERKKRKRKKRGKKKEGEATQSGQPQPQKVTDG